MSLRRFFASAYDNKFPSLVASFFLRRYLAVSTSYFFLAAINSHPLFVTISTHTSAYNAVAFQSPTLRNDRTSLCTQSVHSFSFPHRPLCTAPSRFPNMIRFGNRPPAKVISYASLSYRSRTRLSRGQGCTRSFAGLIVYAVP